MTAQLVITDHGELDNSGQLPHAVLDDYAQNTAYVIVSGSAGPVPPSARKLKAGPGITFTDNGPGNDLVIQATGGGSISWMEKPSGNNDGVNVDFVLANSPLPSGSLMFFYNGVLQEQGPSSDYTVSGNVVHLLFAPKPNSNFAATYPF